MSMTLSGVAPDAGTADYPTKVYRTELTPVSFLRRSAAVFPDKTAVVHGNRGSSCAYRELAARVDRLASALRLAGLEKGDRVAFLCPNIPALLEAHFAVPAAGGVFVPINTRLAAAEIGAIVRHAGARFLFVDHELAPLVASLAEPQLAVVRIDDSGAPDDPYEQFLATGSPHPPDTWLTDEEEAISLCYTSGTTGRPKGVTYTHRGAYLNALGNVIETGLNADSVFLWTQAMFHCNGWCFPWSVVATAGTQICLRKLEPALVWDLFEAYG
jgi:fatty-acyl-CoA synthase